MASKSPEDKVEFLLKVLATCTEFKPNYNALKDATGINTASNAQRQFKGIVEASKQYILDSSKGSTRIVENNGTTPVKTTAKKRSKNDAENGDDNTPVKKIRKSASKKPAAELTDEENGD